MRKWLGLAALVVILDQFSKSRVRSTFSLHESIEVTPFFNLVFVFNRGAAFSFLSMRQAGSASSSSRSRSLASVWIVWLLRKHAAQSAFCFALSLILGGAIGNVIDRLVSARSSIFSISMCVAITGPSFNVADTAITAVRRCSCGKR